MGDYRRVAVLTGAARSGTTWVQNLLGSHPDVVTPQETNLFSNYIAPWHRQWRKSLPESEKEWQDRRHNGLPSVITEEEFDRVVGEVIERIYGAAWRLEPSASVLLDKTPGYGFFGGLILHYLPDARILHLIRDGRDVTGSLQRASRGFGELWAASTVDYAAWAWQANVTAGRELRGADAYDEVRYEDLRGPNGPSSLRSAFEFLGVETDAAECEEILRRFSLEENDGRPPSSIVFGGEVMKRLGGRPAEPPDFFGKGEVGGWRETFGWYDRWLFDRYAGKTLVECGYEGDRSWAKVGRVRRAVGHTRFFLSRWRVLLGSGLSKAKRNIKPRQRQAPSTAAPGSKLLEGSRASGA